MIRVATRRYEASHTRKPRGFGMWIFEITSSTSAERVTVTFTGNYSDARKLAVARAREYQNAIVTVMP